MTGQVETAKDLGDEPQDLCKRWLREIELADEHEKCWRERAQKIIDLYRDEKKKDESSSNDATSHRFNILFANTEVLKGALYSRVPIPDVRRRFLDKDPVGRLGAQVLQRGLSYAIDSYDFDGMLKACVEDMVLPGRGVARVRYVPTYSGEGEAREVVYEEVQCDYVEWEMFRYSPAKRWSKVRWVAFGELLTRDDLVAQFGNKGKACKLNVLPKGMEDTEDNQLFKRALVWTIWNKSDRKIYVVSEGYSEGPLDTKDDPLRLEAFFPCPAPIYDISNTSTLIPVPEYAIYQDQAIQLEELSQRIAVLTEALRRRGVYDKSQKELERLAHAGDNDFIGVDEWARFTEKGGLESAWQECDIEPLAKVLVQLIDQAERKKAAIYEIIGLSDIMRGTTKAEETLGAQQLKSQYGEIRIGPRQAEVARFARDLLRMKAEIMSEHFQPQTLAMMTGFDLFADEKERGMYTQMAQQAQAAQQPPPPGFDMEKFQRPSWEQIMKVLKSDKLRGYRIDVESDSTIKPQADEEQKNRTEAIAGLSAFLDKALPAVQGGMMPAKVASELMMFGIRGFKVGPQLEEVLDEWAESSQKEQPGPDMAAIQAKMQQMDEREKAITQGEEQVAKRLEQAKAAEQSAKDKQYAADLAEVELKKNQEMLAVKQKVYAFMEKTKAEAQAKQDEIKAQKDAMDEQQHQMNMDETTAAATAPAKAGTAKKGKAAPASDATPQLIVAVDTLNKMVADLVATMNMPKDVRVERQADGTLQGRVVRAPTLQ